MPAPCALYNFSLGPTSIEGVENLILRVTVSNTGAAPLKLLNEPNGPLSTMPTNTFWITHENGFKPAFISVKVSVSFLPTSYNLPRFIQVKYSLTYAMRVDDESFFTALAPGQSIDISHDRMCGFK
jgi:peptidyl-Lys metalloendopeptidase